MDNKIIGSNVKKYRRSIKLTQEQLAERLDISTVHMSHIECGYVSMSLELLLELCEILKVTPNHILEGTYPDLSDAPSGFSINEIPRQRRLLASKILELLRDLPTS